MKKLKLTLLPTPGGVNSTGYNAYDQQEFDVDDTFEFDVLDGVQWLQFEDTEGTSYAIPMHRVVALALAEK